MTDRSFGNTLLLILVTLAAVGGTVFFYTRYIEPQNTGPMEKAGEKLDQAISHK